MSGRPFAARFLGSCHVCLDDIDPGQQVRYDADHQVVHDDCDAAVQAPSRPEVVCPSCWLAHAGECA